MPRQFYTLELIDGFKITRRGVAFLTSGDGTLDAKKTFEGLSSERKREVSSRFDHWLDGGIHKRYHHGWDVVGYRDCYVFKWKDKRKHHRLYGFLCNPKPKSDPGFRLCVVVSHAIKPGEDTDPAELNGAIALLLSDAVTAAIQKIFPEYGWKRR